MNDDAADAPAAAAVPPLRLLVVDDEPLARLRLRTLVAAVADPVAEVVAEAGDADAALALLRSTAVDAVLLDIGLPGIDGLRLAGTLRAIDDAPALVFVTADAGHALAAFDLDAADYLTKPVRRDRLQQSLQRIAQRTRAASALVRPPPAAGAAVDEPRLLVVVDRDRVLRVPVAEVLVLKAEQKYVTLRTASQTHVIDGSLAELALRLGDGFLRVHRNALVAIGAIRELELRGSDADGWAVRVAPLDEWIAVSRRQLPAVRAALASTPARSPLR